MKQAPITGITEQDGSYLSRAIYWLKGLSPKRYRLARQMKFVVEKAMNNVIHYKGVDYDKSKLVELLVELDRKTSRCKKTMGQLCLLAQDSLPVDIKIDDKAIDYMVRLLGTNPLESIYITSYLQKSFSVRGDVCEFGVAQGRTSALLAHLIKATEKHLWLYDSFEGLPAPHLKDELIHDIFGLKDIRAYQGKMSCPEDEVRQEVETTGLSAHRCHIVKGWVEEAIAAGRLPDRISFAYLDCDFYSPTIAVLHVFHQRSERGAHVVLDDYGHFSSGVETAVTEFLAEHGNAYELIAPRPGAGSFRILARIV